MESFLWGKVMQTSRARILTTHSGSLQQREAFFCMCATG
jgi:hypothetical protein